MKKVPAIQRLLAEGFFDSPDAALPYLLGGAVYCGGVPVRTGGQRIALDAPLTVRGLDEKYVGKGGYKLEGALKDFGVLVEGRCCVDAGACTGGFTDCLVKHGAGLVYAVEAGFGQLAGSLAQNPRVVNLERTNLGDEKLLSLSPAPTLGTADLSYLSLVKAVPQFRAIMQGRGELICLVKPLFEIDDPQARRTGTLREEDYAPLLLELISTLGAQEGTTVLDVTHSPITGTGGTVEFFLLLGFGMPAPSPAKNWQALAAQAVQRALALPRYEKRR